MSTLPTLKPVETWQVAIEVVTEGATEDETALLIFHLEEVLLQRTMITRSFKISGVKVVDAHRAGG